MRYQCWLRIKPFGAFDAVVAAEVGEVFDGLGVLPLREVLGGEEVGLDLIDVPVASRVSIVHDVP